MWSNPVLIYRLRGPKYDISDEMKQLEVLNGDGGSRGSNGASTCLSGLAELTRPPVAKACLLLISLMVLMMACGATIVVFYAVEFFQVSSAQLVMFPCTVHVLLSYRYSLTGA